jgi:hypothetical protein
MIKKGLLTLAVVLLFSVATMAEEATSPTEAFDSSFPFGYTYDRFMYCIVNDSCDDQGVTGDDQLLGVEFDGVSQQYYVTGGGSRNHADTNWFYILDRACHTIASCAQNTASAWGIRDLAWDIARDSLYGSDEYGLYIFDNSCPLPTFLRPLIPPAGFMLPCRALAHDPAADLLWTANFTSDIVCFDPRTGRTVITYPNNKPVYGMAWDDSCHSALGYPHPMLWIFHQGAPDWLWIALFDPDTTGCGGYVADYCLGVSGHPNSYAIAGGLAFDAGNYESGMGKLIAQNQGNASDIIMAYDICELVVLSMRCFNLTPRFCRGTKVFFLVTTTNNTGASFNVTMTFQGYSGYGCVSGSQYGPPMTRRKNIPMGINTGNYRLKVPNAAGPGPYSASISFIYQDTTYSCCMDFCCIACSSWVKIGDNTEWTWEEVDRPEVGLPTITALAQNYPNPFNATTNISFSLAEAGNVSLNVYDITGRLVVTLVDGQMDAGQHVVVWDASNVSSGVYFYKLATADYRATKMMNLLK